MTKQQTVRVRATRNLDLMNVGEVAELVRDDHIDKLIDMHYLIEVDEKNQPVGDENPVFANATYPSGSPTVTGQPVAGAVASTPAAVPTTEPDEPPTAERRTTRSR